MVSGARFKSLVQCHRARKGILNSFNLFPASPTTCSMSFAFRPYARPAQDKIAGLLMPNMCAVHSISSLCTRSWRRWSVPHPPYPQMIIETISGSHGSLFWARWVSTTSQVNCLWDGGLHTLDYQFTELRSFQAKAGSLNERSARGLRFFLIHLAIVTSGVVVVCCFLFFLLQPQLLNQ